MAKNLEQRVAELENLVRNLQKNENLKIRKCVGIGDTFKLAGLEWKVLDITEQGYVCLSMDRYGEERPFDSTCNDWKTSDLRNELNRDLYKKIADEIGADNIIEFGRDLLSLDGQTEYGKCTDKVSLITVDEYRKYRSLIPNASDYWWWMCSPWSTKCNGYERSVTVVSPRVGISSNVCNYCDGVRPFCIFSSAIFESEE